MKSYITALLALLTVALVQGQNRPDTEWKYPAYPELPFTLDEVQLDLQLTPATPLIEGSGRYTVTARQPGVRQIVFHTADVEIQEVFAGEQQVEFRVSEDSLIMMLPDTLAQQESTELLISWESSSPYGIRKDVHGHVWTSLNPKSQHHWFPVPNHPRVTISFSASVTLPADLNVVMNGSLADDEVISTEEKTVYWESPEPVSVTGITMAVGAFRQESARAGVHRVSLYADSIAFAPHLLQDAVSILKKYQDKLGYEYPFENLNVVILPDHQWEEIQAGAGFVYLYENLGSLQTQLKRGIASQWLGNFHRYAEPADPRLEYLRTLVTGSTQKLTNADSLQTITAWNRWQFDDFGKSPGFFAATLTSSLPELINSYNGFVEWSDYAGFWYERTGAYWTEIQDSAAASASNQSTKSIYAVDYQYDEANSRLNLVFNARRAPVQFLADAQLTEYGFADSAFHQITFTGNRDTVSVELERGVEYVTIAISEEEDIELVEQKPLMFLINQLRSSDKTQKIQAARLLREYADEPDLQLALRDVLRTEEDDEVRAALYHSLAVVTGGAAGTEQTFLNLVNLDNEKIQLTALRALANYPENEDVRYAVTNVLRSAESDTVFEAALQTYRIIATQEAVLEVAKNLNNQNQHSGRVLTILAHTATTDTTGVLAEMATDYLEASFPYKVRKQALNLLLQHETEQAFWEEWAGFLQNDRDPRIRFLALNALQYLPEDDAKALLEERARNEFHPRILQKIAELRWPAAQ